MRLFAVVGRLATDRVGVSSCFDDLRDAPRALHFAKVMLRGRPQHASPVAVFDGSILGIAAVAAPEVMVNSIGDALKGFEDLPDDERETLCETFRVWQDSDASVRRAAEVLFCHPNTVRHRLRRIEKRTGRSLTRQSLLLDNSISPTSGGARRCCRTQQRLQCVIRGDIDGGVQRTQRLNSIVGHQLWK